MYKFRISLLISMAFIFISCGDSGDNNKSEPVTSNPRGNDGTRNLPFGLEKATCKIAAAMGTYISQVYQYPVSRTSLESVPFATENDNSNILINKFEYHRFRT